jgi:hypothetical protein
MPYANEMSIFYGSDLWPAVKKSLLAAMKGNGKGFTAEEMLDLAAVHAEMERIENNR